MATVLISGSNRGLGLEFVRQFSERHWKVIACCRTPDDADILNELAAISKGGIEICSLNTTDPESVAELKVSLRDRSLDLLVNNAGILDTKPMHFSENARTTLQSLGNIDYEGWSEVLKVNTIAPLRLTEALLPNLAASPDPKIAMISSIMGSIDANDANKFPPGGGIYLYRSSKAALNMVARSLAADLASKGITVFCLNPGWVKTDMGGDDGIFSINESVGNMIGLIENSTLANTGTFLSHDGTKLAW